MGSKAQPGAFDCYAKLEPNEPYFLIMGRDPMGQQLVEMWALGAEMRLSLGALDAEAVLNKKAQIAEARRCAAYMANYCLSLGKLPMRWNAKAPVINRRTEITRSQIDAVLDDVSLGTAELILELARAAGVPE
jgi:hypothetical protein